jgi:hypothetical protein
VEKGSPPRDCFTNAVFGVFGHIQAELETQVHPKPPIDAVRSEQTGETLRALVKLLMTYDPEKKRFT